MVSRRTAFMGALLAGSALALQVACSDYRSSTGETVDERRDTRIQEARATAELFRQRDPTIERFFERSAGYAIFPTVTKGAAGIGAAHGYGVVFEADQPVGWVEVTQGSIGAQLGGQTYRELIFFENEMVLKEFKRENLEFQAQASAVAAASGAAANADFDDGVAVFTMAHEGLMFEASIGGQNFDYTPMRR